MMPKPVCDTMRMTHLKLREHHLTVFLYIGLTATTFRKQDNRIFQLHKFIVSVLMHVQESIDMSMLNTVVTFYFYPP